VPQAAPYPAAPSSATAAIPPGVVAAATAPRETLAGLVERVTFHNAKSGFCVLRVKARGQRDLVTVVGFAAQISAGEWVSAVGVWVNDRPWCADQGCRHTGPYSALVHTTRT